MFELIKNQKKLRLGTLTTTNGTVQTPMFMNVATSAAIKGGVSAIDLMSIDCQVQLCNTYHLHLRPSDKIIKTLGGLHSFTSFKGPILTDSGGFQVFSLSKLREISEKGVQFKSHIDGKSIFMGPEESMEIQSNLASDIAMAFDECIENPATYDYTQKSCDRTTRWLYRCKQSLEHLNAKSDTINKNQMLFGINQGSTYQDLRIKHMEDISKLDLDGYAIGGLAVGETAKEMYEVLDYIVDYMPKNKPRYLMGVGTPENILQSVYRGVDMFDCVMPSRNGRHGHLNTWNGIINITNAKYITDSSPIDTECNCMVCNNHSRAYIRHLFKAKEALGMRLAVMHNLHFYNNFMKKIRESIKQDNFDVFFNTYTNRLDKRI